MRLRDLAIASIAAVLCLGLLAGPAAAAAPQWKLTVTPGADYFFPAPDEVSFYTVEAENVGDAPTLGGITLQDSLPSPLGAAEVRFYATPTGIPAGKARAGEGEGNLAPIDCAGLLKCKYPASSPLIEPGQKLIMLVRVVVPSEAEAPQPLPLEDRAQVSGGGATPVEAGASNSLNSDPPFGFHGFAADLAGSSGAGPYTQAGGHPYQFTVQLDFATASKTNQKLGENKSDTWGYLVDPVRDPRDAGTDLPPGLIGNPQAALRCPLAEFFAHECPLDTVVGTGAITTGLAQGGASAIGPIYNLKPAGNHPAELGFIIKSITIVLVVGVRSGSDYGISATSFGTPPSSLHRFRATIWGVPADPSHDPIRGTECAVGKRGEEFVQSVEQLEAECANGEIDGTPNPGGPAGVPRETAFLTMPTRCDGQPLRFAAHSNSWQLPAQFAAAGATAPPVDGCNQLRFEPRIEARPTTSLADSPSGFDFDLHLPQQSLEDPTALAQADLHEAVVRMPAGLSVNPAAANGLDACSPAQIGLTTPIGSVPAHFSEEPARCPDASKLGDVEVKTPLLAEPLGSIPAQPGRVGSVYLATPHQNPFGSLLAGYIVLEGQGVVAKLPGQFQVDHQSGQITAFFLENPQLPFEDFKFHFFPGARGALRTPATCGTYQVGSTLTPWSAPESGPPAEPTSEFETSAGPSEGACPTDAPQEPHSFSFHAGTESPTAGAYSPFSLKLVRQDGEQEIKQIETTLPEGLVGRLAGTTYCPDAALGAAAGKSGVAEQQSPSCPASSEVGTVDVAAGAGPTPLNVSGKAYLAGPYKGAPLSLAIVTPAVAGPFDLGTVVVRTALDVDPFTTQITARSDPIPTILEGIPLDVRSVTLQLQRPNFTLNPTDCEAKVITGSALTTLGATAPLNQRYQVGGCPALPFKPELSLRLEGSPKRAKFPALTATLTMPKGNANIAAAQVTLPHSSFLSQGHIAKTCGRPELASHTCPAASIYGHAKAVTPLLDHPLEGPVYLATGFGYELPALVADLNGQIEVLLKGKVDSGREDGIRNTFEVVPDAPVSKFTLHMFGGKRSLIENSQYLCGRHAKRKALARFTAQNGKTLTLEPTVANSCKKKHGGHHKKHKRHGRGHGNSGHAAGRQDRTLAALLLHGW